MKNLTPTETTEFSLWKTTRKTTRELQKPIKLGKPTETRLKMSGTKNNTDVFQPYSSYLTAVEEEGEEEKKKFHVKELNLTIHIILILKSRKRRKDTT